MIIHGDALTELKKLESNSIDSVVTDPPYGISFMGKKWDYDVPSVEVFKEILRVLKPGGHALIACGTRTQHRMVCNIEDAGFEVRDVVTWLYGSGFPKSHDVSKAIDKHFGAEREVVGQKTKPFTATGRNNGRALNKGLAETVNEDGYLVEPITAPSTDEAKQFQGYGTALKPAVEFFTLVRKPLEGTVAQNVLKYGVGGLNIDASRVGENATGRWPANLVLDEEAAAALDEQTGLLQSRPNKNPRPVGEFTFVNQKDPTRQRQQYETEPGGASRFFYVAKASKKERGEGNNHPTVKPLKLMEYLIKLITPPNGTVLDPFMGSGSTLVAACKNDFGYIGIEREEAYVEIAKKRVESAKEAS